MQEGNYDFQQINQIGHQIYRSGVQRIVWAEGMHFGGNRIYMELKAIRMDEIAKGVCINISVQWIDYKQMQVA